MKIADFINKIINMPKKKRIILLSIAVLTISTIVLTIVLVTKTKNKNSLSVQENQASLEMIPEVNNENTKISISTFEEAENVTITVEEKLEEYDLLYFIEPTVAEIVLEGEEESQIDKIEDTATNIEDTINFASKDDFSTYTKYVEPIHIEENSKIYLVYCKDGKFSERASEIQISNIVKVLQEEEEVSEEDLKKAQVSKSLTGDAPYYIKVNYGANVVTIYGKDDDGNYTVPVKAMICSCGVSTPKSGVYKTSRGYEWGKLIGGVYGQYSTRIVKSILFHSVPYTNMYNDCLEYWEFDKLGTTASAGCVRLMVADAKWIFNNCGSGTMVEFYSSDDPGPLGKPSAPKISDNERCRDWDPTDDVEGNPWFEKEETSVVEVDNEVGNENENITPNDTSVIQENSEPQNTTSADTTPTNTIPENTLPDNTTPEDTTPENTTPDNTWQNNQENPPQEPDLGDSTSV